MAPYRVAISVVADRFCSSPERAKLFRGLLALRGELVALGLVRGVQWINGSFCEDVEAARGRGPADIDLVTLLMRPAALQLQPEWQKFCIANQRVLDHASTKSLFGCDAYYIDASFPALMVADQITYWFGLFTHQRVTNLWKGIVEVPLVSDDAAAAMFIDSKFPP